MLVAVLLLVVDILDILLDAGIEFNAGYNILGVVTNTELGKPYKPEESNFYIHNFYGFKGVDKGFHSFKTLEDTKSIVDGYKENFILVIYKCIIPKGSLYYSGKFRKYESYCSNNIKLIEVCV